MFENTEPGDLLVRHDDNRARLVAVERVTKAQIITGNNTRWNRNTGNLVGGGTSTRHITEPKDGEVNQLLVEAAVRRTSARVADAALISDPREYAEELQAAATALVNTLDRRAAQEDT